MRKILIFFSGIILFFSVRLGFALEESFTITTYYPSPYGSYDVLQLYPRSTEPDCEDAQRGTMYYNSDDNTIYICKGTTLSWQAVGSGWTDDGAVVRLTTSGDSVGIGTTEPGAKLEVTGQYFSTKYTTTTTLDWDNANVQYIVLASGAQTFTFANPKDGGRYLLILKQPAGGAAGTVTWPAAVLWSGGTAPTLTTTNSKVDVITFVYDATNTKYYAGSNLNY